MENENATPPDAPSSSDNAPSASDNVDGFMGDPYCFESDHVALKNNPDYHRLMRTICLLEAQRAQAIKDLDLLHEAQAKVLEDPIGYVDILQRTGSFGLKLPGPLKIAEVPEIDWEKYTNNVDFTTLGSQRQSARLRRQRTEAADENLQRLKNSLVAGPDVSEGTVAEGFVRGRYKDESKSATFNKLWTPEEQRRLDELLIEYPPEAVEASRWRKIAAALGNRTPQQVASRVQKYFAVLEQNRLPVPGRVPNRGAQRHRRNPYRHQRRNWAYHESTFLQKYKPPVMMKEEDDDELFNPPPQEKQSFMNPARVNPPADKLIAQEDSDDDDIPQHLKDSAEYKELKQLKKLREQRVQALDSSVALHEGFMCDRCKCSPIVGTRWHCVDCPSSISVDFCKNCYDKSPFADRRISAFETTCHNSSHRVRPVKRVWNKQTTDKDYMNFTSDAAASNYNYLDPNFMPAV